MVAMNNHEKSPFNPWGKASVNKHEQILLEGPRKRISDLRTLFHIIIEFIKGFHTFRNLRSCVTVFGSARFLEYHPYYQLAHQTASLLARSGFSIMTGGGPGIMEAANKGAREVGGLSLGCNITLPIEQKPNNYLDKFVEFDHFYIRKVMLLRYSCAFVVFPGGFGTLDEFFETLTLIQTKKISNFPIIMMGMDFWHPLKDFIFDTLLENHTINAHDIELISFTDDIDYTLERIITYAGCA